MLFYSQYNLDYLYQSEAASNNLCSVGPIWSQSVRHDSELYITNLVDGLADQASLRVV